MLDSIPSPAQAKPSPWKAVAVVQLIVAGLHFLWAGLYVFHARINPALPMRFAYLMAAAGLPFVGLAALARVGPRAAALLGIVCFFGVHLAIAMRWHDWSSLGGGAVVKLLILIILLRAYRHAADAARLRR